MRWSKVKKLVEDSFAESIKGRIKLYSTRYGQSSLGRGWITIDGKEKVDLSTLLSGSKYQAYYHESTKTHCAKHPSVPDKERSPGNLIEPGELSRFDLHEACWEYIHSNINDCLKSENPLIVSLAILNAKVGKNRLKKIAIQKLHPLTQSLLAFRMKEEGIG